MQISWLKKFKQPKCRACKKPLPKNPVVLELNASDGVIEYAVCDDCFNLIKPMVLGDV